MTCHCDFYFKESSADNTEKVMSNLYDSMNAMREMMANFIGRIEHDLEACIGVKMSNAMSMIYNLTTNSRTMQCGKEQEPV